MEEILSFISTTDGSFRYVFLAGLSFLISMGIIPTTTDLILVCTGVLSQMGYISPIIAIPLVMLSITIGESLLFLIGRKLGEEVFGFKFVKSVINEKKQEYLKDLLANNEKKALFILRFTPFFKATVLFAASCLGLSSKTFRNKYIPLTLAYAFIYMVLPYYLASFFEFTPKGFLFCIAIVFFSLLLIQFFVFNRTSAYKTVGITAHE